MKNLQRLLMMWLLVKITADFMAPKVEKSNLKNTTKNEEIMIYEYIF